MHRAVASVPALLIAVGTPVHAGNDTGAGLPSLFREDDRKLDIRQRQFFALATT